MENALQQEIQRTEALLQKQKTNKPAFNQLVSLYINAGEPLRALATAKQFAKANDEDHEALFLCASLELYFGNEEAAFNLAKKVIGLNPLYLGAYMTIALYHEKTNDVKNQIIALEKLILAAKVLYGENFKNALVSQAEKKLATTYIELGLSAKAVEAYRQCSLKAEDKTEEIFAYSSYLMCLHYLSDLNQKEIWHFHESYNDFFADTIPYNHPKPVPKDKIRLGYVSPDFRNHVVIYFIYHLFKNFNPNAFEVYCYCNCTEDSATAQLKNPGITWRAINELSPADAAKQIHDDAIDILFELSGHTAHNCLPILAYKPAPVQICGIGYFNTTGLKAIDYFLTDIHVDPAAANDGYFSEKLLRLPHSHWCYTKRSEAPACQDAPSKTKDYISFCCFNTFAKVTDEMLLVWKKILASVPNSRLVLKNKIFNTIYGIETVCQRLLLLGFDLKQVQCLPLSLSHMKEYLDMDIALDTFPYVGGGTSCEALYMGVPLITLAGTSHGSRFGLSILKNIGLEECIAYDKEDYVKKAVSLAKNKERLYALHRSELRDRMENSPLMDAPAYMQDLETAYQKIWADYIASH